MTLLQEIQWACRVSAKRITLKQSTYASQCHSFLGPNRNKASKLNYVLRSLIFVISYHLHVFLVLARGNDYTQFEKCISSEIQMFWRFLLPGMISKAYKTKKTAAASLFLQEHRHPHSPFHFNHTTANSSTRSYGATGSCTPANVTLLSLIGLLCQGRRLISGTKLPVRPSHEFLQRAELHSAEILW